MARENCEMMIEVAGRICCDHYDYGCRECERVKNCPSGRDDDDVDDEEE